MLTTGVWALRALCRLASPLPRPGPRCSSTAAGRSAMRAYPSAAPVATPSNRARTPRISGTSSSAATKCISEVPGFMKQTSTPASTSVRIRAWAPFMGSSWSVEDGAGVEDPGWVEGRLDAAHEVELGGVLDGGQVLLLLGADAVLARDRAAEGRTRGEHLAHHLREDGRV